MGRPKKDKPKKGEKPVTKSDKLEHARRVRQVLDWILGDQMTLDIVNSGMAKWGVSDRQIYRYISDANGELKRVSDDNLVSDINYQMQRSKRALRQMDEKHKNTPSGVFAVVRVLEHMAKIRGLYVQKVEVVNDTKKVGFIDLKAEE